MKIPKLNLHYVSKRASIGPAMGGFLMDRIGYRSATIFVLIMDALLVCSMIILMSYDHDLSKLMKLIFLLTVCWHCGLSSDPLSRETTSIRLDKHWSLSGKWLRRRGSRQRKGSIAHVWHFKTKASKVFKFANNEQLHSQFDSLLMIVITLIIIHIILITIINHQNQFYPIIMNSTGGQNGPRPYWYDEYFLSLSDF